jgi:hypothetical protein
MTVLARPLYIPFDHTTTVGLPYSLTRHITICPPTTAEPFDPTIIFGRPILSLLRSGTILGSTITNPIKKRALGLLANLNNPSVAQFIEILIKQGVLTKNHKKVWKKARP